VKLDSVRSFKTQVSDEVKAQAGDGPGLQSFFEATEAPMPDQMGLGVSKLPNGEHILAIRSTDPAAAAAMAARVNGEAEIRIIKITPRNTPAYYQARRRPLEPGLQIGMANKNFVGTLGCFARDGDGNLGVVSNAHVLADSGLAQLGHPFGQPYGTNPADRVGVLTKWLLPTPGVPGIADAVFARLDKTNALVNYSGVLGGAIKGARRTNPDDLGREVVKGGRTTGGSLGKILVVELDGVQVSYPSGLLSFNDALEISGGPATDFSAAGDSGSMILDRDGWAIGLLWAGGVVGGTDYTYANPLLRVLNALGVTLA
jgi:hypothetical protein